MATAEKIREALELMKVNPANWNSDGTPKLTALQVIAGDDTITMAQMVQAAGGVPSKDDTDAESTGDSADATKAAPQPAIDTSKPDAEGDEGTGDGKAPEPEEPTHQDIIAGATEAITELEPEVQAAKAQAQAAADTLAAITAKKDALGQVIEEHTEKLSRAQAVQRIQRQTQEGLERRKESLQAVHKAAQQVGVLQYASELDASLARGGSRSVVIRDGKTYVATPQTNAINAGKYYAQQAAARIANRTGG